MIAATHFSISGQVSTMNLEEEPGFRVRGLQLENGPKWSGHGRQKKANMDIKRPKLVYFRRKGNWTTPNTSKDYTILIKQ